MNKNNRNNEQIYGRNDMIMLDPNNKIYGSLGIADNYVMKTEEGTRLMLSNPKLGRFGDVLTEFNIYGRSEQKQYRGKNLLKIRDGVQTERGVTVTAKDGVVALKGTATETGWTILDIDSFVLDGTCILSANTTAVRVVLANKSYITVLEQNKSNTLENAEVSKVCFVVEEGKTYDISNILVQIEKGSEATSYEPYVGGQPSPSPDYPQEIKRVVNPTMKVCGKNLWDNFKTLSLGNVEQKNGTYIATADTMQVDITSSSIGARPLLLKANNAYTFSLKTTVSISSPKFVCLRYTNGERDNIIFTNKNFVNFVPERDVEKIGFILYESVAGDKAYDVQLEMGSEATAYEPYTEQSVQLPYTLNAIPVASGGNVTIDGQQWVCDEVDLERGVKVQRVKVRELSPDDKWSYQKLASGNNNFQIMLFNADIAKYFVPCFCNILPFKNVIWNDSIQNLPKIYAFDTEITVSFPPSSEYSSLEAFKQLLTNVKSVIYYALATPIETDLMPEEIEQYKKLSIRTPTTIVENNYNTWMKATYKSIESA